MTTVTEGTQVAVNLSVFNLKKSRVKKVSTDPKLRNNFM